MADVPTYYSNPWGDFDPTQWANQFSNFQNSALPMPSYVGMPYNSMGQPIQPPPGMTVNQTPAQPTPVPAAAAAPQGMTSQQAWALAQQLGGSGVQGSGRGTTSPQGALDAYNQLMAGQPLQAQEPWLQQQQAAPQAAPQPVANSAGLTPQQYMALRANPGQVTTPGATVPQSSSSWQPSSGVLQQFLQNWKPASSGPGSGFQQGFAKSLKGMGY